MGRKKTKRDLEEFPNINPAKTLKIRLDYSEVDYAHKLNKETLAYLDTFNKEFVNADLSDPVLHTTPELIKDCQRRNNNRNSCLFARSKASSALTTGIKPTDTDFEGSSENDELLSIFKDEDDLKNENMKEKVRALPTYRKIKCLRYLRLGMSLERAINKALKGLDFKDELVAYLKNNRLL